MNCCVTSPPYYGLRDYGLDAQIGREDTPEQYIDRLTEVFRELRRYCVLTVRLAEYRRHILRHRNKGYHADPKNPKGRNGQQIAKTTAFPAANKRT